MSGNKDGGPAFPTPEPIAYVERQGMSLRDWFAGQALAGIASRQNFRSIEPAAASQAYELADAMLTERSKP